METPTMEAKQAPNFGAYKGDGRRLVGEGTTLERDLRGSPEAEAGLCVPASDAQSRLSVHQVRADFNLLHWLASMATPMKTDLLQSGKPSLRMRGYDRT